MVVILLFLFETVPVFIVSCIFNILREMELSLKAVLLAALYKKIKINQGTEDISYTHRLQVGEVGERQR